MGLHLRTAECSLLLREDEHGRTRRLGGTDSNIRLNFSLHADQTAHRDFSRACLRNGVILMSQVTVCCFEIRWIQSACAEAAKKERCDPRHPSGIDGCIKSEKICSMEAAVTAERGTVEHRGWSHNIHTQGTNFSKCKPEAPRSEPTGDPGCQALRGCQPCPPIEAS